MVQAVRFVASVCGLVQSTKSAVGIISIVGCTCQSKATAWNERRRIQRDAPVPNTPYYKKLVKSARPGADVDHLEQPQEIGNMNTSISKLRLVPRTTLTAPSSVRPRSDQAILSRRKRFLASLASQGSPRSLITGDLICSFTRGSLAVTARPL